jgi:2-polyprenyl-3-methyl-5-hydroxy-6-metoxy-1,4-benzoquinol methylase
LKKSVREGYEALGVHKYYLANANDYSNPHFEQIKQLIEQNHTKFSLNSVLDLGSGSGEVTLILQSLGYNNIEGMDPYTYKLYTHNTGSTCSKLTFEDIVKGKLKKNYESIICSFAMHLCDEAILGGLTYQLFQHTQHLIIITPHKRPVLENFNNIQLIHSDFALTPKGKKVHLKHYFCDTYFNKPI